MSKITQKKKELRAKGDGSPDGAHHARTVAYAPAPPQPARTANGNLATNEPRLSSWRPKPEDPQGLRYWEPPRMGDIVQCRFPDFLRGEFSIQTSVKIRPCMVVGVEEFASGQVAYGSSQVQDHDRVDGVQPGEILIPAADTKTGLKSDTKFSMRKVLTLPFSTDHFAPAEGGRFGVYPKRGQVDLKKPEYRRALDSAIADFHLLGSALEETSQGVRLRKCSLAGGAHMR